MVAEGINQALYFMAAIVVVGVLAKRIGVWLETRSNFELPIILMLFLFALGNIFILRWVGHNYLNLTISYTSLMAGLSLTIRSYISLTMFKQTGQVVFYGLLPLVIIMQLIIAIKEGWMTSINPNFPSKMPEFLFLVLLPSYLIIVLIMHVRNYFGLAAEAEWGSQSLLFRFLCSICAITYMIFRFAMLAVFFAGFLNVAIFFLWLQFFAYLTLILFLTLAYVPNKAVSNRLERIRMRLILWRLQPTLDEIRGHYKSPYAGQSTTRLSTAIADAVAEIGDFKKMCRWAEKAKNNISENAQNLRKRESRELYQQLLQVNHDRVDAIGLAYQYAMLRRKGN